MRIKTIVVSINLDPADKKFKNYNIYRTELQTCENFFLRAAIANLEIAFWWLLWSLSIHDFWSLLAAYTFIVL